MKNLSMRIFTSLLLLVFLPCLAKSEVPYVVVNIGFRIGYIVSGNTGWIGGFEISMNYYEDIQGFGVAFSSDFTKGKESVHCELQGFYKLLGVSAGPSFFNSSDHNLGFSCTFFGGAIVLPFYKITFRKQELNDHEVGTFIKWPFIVRHPNFNI